MTRVNLVDPETLIDEHLVAEYREIKRIVNNPPKNNNIPTDYVLGKGHVTFFKDKLDYIRYRHKLIVVEMKRRNITVNIELDGPTTNDLWQPNQEEIMMSATRIMDRIITMKKEPHYNKQHITREDAIEKILSGV